MEDEIIFLLICFQEMLNKRLITLHNLLFIASRYLLMLLQINLVKNMSVCLHFSFWTAFMWAAVTRSKLESYREMSQFSRKGLVRFRKQRNADLFHCSRLVTFKLRIQISWATKCGIYFIAFHVLSLDQWTEPLQQLNVDAFALLCTDLPVEKLDNRL